MVLAPGSVGQVSFSAITPAVLVMTKFCAARSGNCGRSGGASTWACPNWASVQLILVNSRKPLSVPLWPKRLLLFASLAAAIQAARCGSWRARQRAETLVRMPRGGHLRRGAGVGGDGESAADLAELASLRDVQATFS